MKAKDWQAVSTEGGYDRIPAGGYVLVVTGVKDVPSKEYLEINYEVAEGQLAGFYADKPVYHSRMYQNYSEKSEYYFKLLLEAFEASNPGFTIEAWQRNCNEQEFLDLKFGGLIQAVTKTSAKGNDYTSMEVEAVIPADDVRSGNYTMPEPRDGRPDHVKNAAADPYPDIPFDVSPSSGSYL